MLLQILNKINLPLFLPGKRKINEICMLLFTENQAVSSVFTDKFNTFQIQSILGKLILPEGNFSCTVFYLPGHFLPVIKFTAGERFLKQVPINKGKQRFHFRILRENGYR